MSKPNNRQAYLLICLMEECAEISKEASKALRFGLADRYEGTTPESRLTGEYNDLLEVVYQLQCAGLHIRPNKALRAAKRDKLAKAMTYSRKTGMIKP